MICLRMQLQKIYVRYKPTKERKEFLNASEFTRAGKLSKRQRDKSILKSIILKRWWFPVALKAM